MASKMANNPRKPFTVHLGEILNEKLLLQMNITQYRLAKATARMPAGFIRWSTGRVSLFHDVSVVKTVCG